MEKYDLLPTEENLRNALKEDSTGRNKDIYSLLKLLTSQKGSWSIALNGAWGTGKTFFVKQTQYVLEALNSTVDADDTEKIVSLLHRSEEDLTDIKQKSFRTIYYDAWEHDDEEDPIQSILSSIPYTNWSKEVKSTVLSVLNAGAKVVDSLTPLNLEDITKKLVDNYEEYSKSFEELRKEFNIALSKLAPKNGQLIIFVDELDRCKPTYAVKLLERIKHYFVNPNVTFIFSVDLVNLQNTIKHYYGTEFDGYHYLDRFFDLVINLPEPDLEKYLESTKDMLKIDDIFEGQGSRSLYHQFCAEVINHFSFSLRQINHFYLKVNSAAYNFINNSVNAVFPTLSNGSLILYQFFLPFMCALSQDNIGKYNKFIKGNADEEELRFLAESPAFKRYYKFLFNTEDQKNLDFLCELKKIYNAIFRNTGNSNEPLLISNDAKIESPNYYKANLIKACSLFSDRIAVD